MAEFKLRRGHDIRLAGQSDGQLVDAPRPERVAVKPIEFRGIKPRLLVAEGDAVKIGSPLFHAKTNEEHRFSAPASGRVAAINRGHRRSLLSIVIECDGKDEAESFRAHDPRQLAGLDRQAVLQQVLAAGLLGVFTQRPFGNTARPDIAPRDIFVTCFDSAPLAPDTACLLQGQKAYFEAGVLAATALTDGKVHLGLNGRAKDLSAFLVDHPKVIAHRFIGPHPSGNVGVQIHHIAPIRGRQDVVWTANVQDILLLGHLFLDGKVDPRRAVAVAGTGAVRRHCFRTVLGASIASLVPETAGSEVRYIAGNALTGRKESATGFIGYHDTMVTVLPEAIEPEFAGWMLPGGKKESFYRAFASRFLPGKTFAQDTRLGGGHRAMVATGYYEQVLPMNLYPQYLIKSILAEDFEEMEGLGIYEVIEEDLALCEYVCPSKTEWQAILRQGLDLIEKEG